MATVRTSASTLIDAPAAAVYTLLADYDAHAKILPPTFFKKLEVLQGGYGAGTVFDLQVEAMGIKKYYHMTVSEPEPGRILQEHDPKIGTTTTFVVEPHGQQTLLEITTAWTPSAGIMGLIERLTVPALTKRVFKQQFQLIKDYLLRQRVATL